MGNEQIRKFICESEFQENEKKGGTAMFYEVDPLDCETEFPWQEFPLDSSPAEQQPGGEEILSFRQYILDCFEADYVLFLERTIRFGLFSHPASPLDVQLRGLRFYKKSSTEIYMDVILSAFIRFYTIEGYPLGDGEKWFRIRMVTDLRPGVEFCNMLQSVTEYDKNEPAPGPALDEYLIPYTRKVLLDSDAASLLRSHYDAVLQAPTRVDGMELARRMNLSVVFHRLVKEKTSAQLYYEERALDVLDQQNQLCTVTIPAHTIVIDMDSCCSEKGLRIPEKVNEKMIHEEIHYERHRLFYLGQRLCHRKPCTWTNRWEENEKYLDLSKTQRPGIPFDPLDRVEWQARALTPRMLMPENVTRQKIEGLYTTLRKKNPGKTEQEITEMVAVALSRFFGVSRQMAKNRMIDLGYHQAHGVLNYVNGGYAPLFRAALGAIRQGQRVTVSLEELLSLYEKDKGFRQIMDSGKYVYADGFVCRREEKYLCFGERAKGKPTAHLTTYALEHAEECCLVFTLKKREKRNGFVVGILDSEDPEEFARMELGERFSSLSREMVTTYGKAEQEAAQFKKDLRFGDPPKEWERMSFSEALMYLTHWRGISYTNCAIKAGISVTTMKRYRTAPTRPGPN